MTNETVLKLTTLKIVLDIDNEKNISDIIVKIKVITGFTNKELAEIMGYSAPTRISEFIHEKQTPSNQGITALYYWVSINLDFIQACMEAQDVEFVEQNLIEIITPKNILKN